MRCWSAVVVCALLGATFLGARPGSKDTMETRATLPARKRVRTESAESQNRDARTETPEMQTGSARTESAETTIMQAVLAEMRLMREEQRRREEEFYATIRQLSSSNPFFSRSAVVSERGDVCDREVRAGGVEMRNNAENGSEGGARAVLGFKLKPDTFDGSASLREFFAQFDLIARANSWNDAAKTVALASCLRGKARSILESVESAEVLDFAELRSKLELRFGEGLLSQDYCTQFSGRRQKFGEDFATFGAELERLARLAYPECAFAVRDKIACTQFNSSLLDGYVKRTVRLEGVSSLKAAMERAKAVKLIQGEFYEGRRNFEKEKRSIGK